MPKLIHSCVAYTADVYVKHIATFGTTHCASTAFAFQSVVVRLEVLDKWSHSHLDVKSEALHRNPNAACGEIEPIRLVASFHRP